MIAACIFCGEPADDDHDITARGADGRYLDPELKSPLCHSCHELCGDDLYTHGLAVPGGGSTFLESLELRLARLGVFLGRLAEALPEPLAPLAALIGLLALHLARWREGLHRSIAALDRYSPGWRDAPGV
jgi:hypothetical protein